MRRVLTFCVLVAGLVAIGYVAGLAQTTQPTFELVVDAPGGETSVRCVRGCTLKWVERGVNPNDKAIQTFQFSCSGPRCSSARVGGWLVP